MQSIKYITKTTTFTGAIAAGEIREITEELPSEFSRVEGIAFYEAKNAAGRDYDLKVADNSAIHQDYCTRFDFLSLIGGTTYRNIEPSKCYKPYAMASKGNTLKLGVKFIDALAGGETITLKLVIKCVN